MSPTTISATAAWAHADPTHHDLGVLVSAVVADQVPCAGGDNILDDACPRATAAWWQARGLACAFCGPLKERIS
jgi:hypothetical protein